MSESHYTISSVLNSGEVLFECLLNETICTNRNSCKNEAFIGGIK